MRGISCFVAVLLLLPVTAAAADGPRVAEAAAADVRVRTGPAMKHPAVAKLAQGDLVLVLGDEGLWKKVRLPGGFACFVHSSLVRRERPGEAVVDADRVLLRPTAGKEQLPLETVLGKGDPLDVLGEEGEWLRVIAPESAHLYVYAELLKDLGPAAEYRRRLDDEASARRESLLSGRSPEALKADREARQKALREEALALGEQVLAGTGDAAELRRRIDSIALAAEDELTGGYANALLALLALRESVERLRLELGSAEAEKNRTAEELQAMRGRLSAAERDYQASLEKARELRALREGAFQAVGVVEAREGGFVLVHGDRPLYRLESERFRLADYLGRRVAVSGRMVFAGPDSTSGRLLVEKLEILPAEPRPR
ncbi:MAG: hypothetical protein MUE73_01925 [Planctomycetes bacterium]|nr:hypothetical protein [Planctomycetota bacterium]